MKSFSLKKHVDQKQPKKKFGGFSLKNKPASTKESNLKKTSVLLQDEPQPDPKDELIGKKIEITSIDEVNKSSVEEELIIKPKFGENSWEYKRQRALDKLHQNQQQKQQNSTSEHPDNDSRLQYGINILQKTPIEPTNTTTKELVTKEHSIEERARISLLNNEDDTTVANTLIIEQPDREISQQDSGLNLNNFPEPATLDSYKRIPVEKFGMAMLRGMGWKGDNKLSSSSSSSATSTKPRVPLLGVGAKSAGYQEEKEYRTGSRQYSPVVLIDAQTGEKVDVNDDDRDRSPIRGNRNESSYRNRR